MGTRSLRQDQEGHDDVFESDAFKDKPRVRVVGTRDDETSVIVCKTPVNQRKKSGVRCHRRIFTCFRAMARMAESPDDGESPGLLKVAMRCVLCLCSLGVENRQKGV
jgi:hypothetical protein